MYNIVWGGKGSDLRAGSKVMKERDLLSKAGILESETWEGGIVYDCSSFLAIREGGSIDLARW